MSIWNIKYNSKVIYLSLYLLALLIWLFGDIYSKIVNDPSNSNFEFTIGSFIGILFLTSPIIFPFLIVIPYWILKKKIPKRITLNDDTLTIYYNLKSSKSIRLDELGYSINSNDNYSVVTIYKRIKAKRGHFVFKKQMNILGLNYSLGWKKHQIDNIANELNKIDVTLIELKRKGRLFEYLIE